jgi:hypothetical protein
VLLGAGITALVYLLTTPRASQTPTVDEAPDRREEGGAP